MDLFYIWKKWKQNKSLLDKFAIIELLFRISKKFQQMILKENIINYLQLFVEISAKQKIMSIAAIPINNSTLIH